MGEKRNYVGFYPRMLAHNIDLVILLPFFYLIGYFVKHNLVLVLLCALLYIIYHVIFEASRWKGTPGKRLQRISIEAASDQNQPDFRQVLIRNTSKVLSAVPFFAGFIMVFFDKKERTLHDRLAGTVVIFDEN